MTKIYWPIYGHKKTKEQLERDFENNKVAHTILLSGPANIGKYSLATNFAKLLQCEKGDLCGKCVTCRAIDNETHLDTMFYEDTDEKDLGIEVVRGLKAQLNLTSQGKFKVVVIQNIERLSIPSQNALLKILEEPPDDVYFLLTTRDHKALLETVVSRCRIFRLRALPEAEIERYLLNEYGDLDKEYLKSLAEFSGGRIGRIIVNINDNNNYDLMRNWNTELELLHKNGDIAECMRFAEEMAILKGSDRELFFSVLIQFLRKKMLSDQESGSKERLAGALLEAHLTSDLVNQNVNARLALEVLFLHAFAEKGMVNSL